VSSCRFLLSFLLQLPFSIVAQLADNRTPSIREAKEWVGLINKYRTLTMEARDEMSRRGHGFSF
jgi:hypothetical protein